VNAYKEKDMSTLHRIAHWTLMAAALAFSASAFAQTPADTGQAAPEQAAGATQVTPADAITPPMRMHAMRERMRTMREVRDPEERMRMMEEQMADLDTTMKGMADCPMMSGDMPMGRMGMGPMGGEGMMHQRGGMGTMQRRGEAMHDRGMMMQHHPGMMQQHGEMLGKRLDSMEKRLDLMQSIIESHMARGGRMMQ
jgi:hypothetical protein